MLKKVNLKKKFELVKELWDPKIVGQVNDSYVKLAKLEGEFVWHSHDKEDEMFLVVKGEIIIETKEENFTLGEGEFLIIPKGVEHKPKALNEAWVMLFEPVDTLNTGDVKNEMTKEDISWI